MLYRQILGVVGRVVFELCTLKMKENPKLVEMFAKQEVCVAMRMAYIISAFKCRLILNPIFDPQIFICFLLLRGVNSPVSPTVHDILFLLIEFF